MDRKALLHIVEWSVAVVAYAYLVWQLATYDDYASLAESFRTMGWQQWTAVVACVALMPVNMAIEAWKWQTLMSDELTFREAQQQVYYSKLAGLVTPWRLGEYPSRGLMMSGEKDLWPKVLSMGAVGSATMTAAIVLAGVIGLVFSPEIRAMLGDSYLYALVVVIIVLGALYLLMPKMLRKWAEVNQSLLFRTTAQSLVRLLCWCVQLALILYAIGANDQLPITIYQLPIYYLLVTVTPNIPIVEAGVRGAWAMFLFGSVNAALAGVILWVINTLLPCLSWIFLKKNDKTFA